MKCINFWNVHCRLELHTESSSTKPELIFMDQIEEVPSEFTQFKNEQCIQIKFKESIRTGNVVLTNPVSHFILLFVIYTTPAHMFFSYYVFIGKLLYTYLHVYKRAMAKRNFFRNFSFWRKENTSFIFSVEIEIYIFFNTEQEIHIVCRMLWSCTYIYIYSYVFVNFCIA